MSTSVATLKPEDVTSPISGTPPNTSSVPPRNKKEVMVISDFCESSFPEEMKNILNEIYYSQCFSRAELKEYLNPVSFDGKPFTPFRLNLDFLELYKELKPEFGFNGVGEVTYLRTYSRVIEDPLDNAVLTKERWYDTIKRVVEGTMNTMKRHIYRKNAHWNDLKAQKLGQTFFHLMFRMKFLPPGRGLWGMGTPITEDHGFYMALNNCGFISTRNIKELGATIFAWFMDLSMMGCGVGFDTRGSEHRQRIYKPNKRNPVSFVIGDTREGWVSSTAALINSYFRPGQREIHFDYSRIRLRGERLKTFGGIAPGPNPLKHFHKQLKDLFEKKADSGNYLDVRDIVDIFNLIGVCVISGNVRRTAEIAFGPHDSQEFIELKDYEKNPDRMEYGWTSNNSIFAETGMDYSMIAENILKNGEPGLMWLENAQENGRMSGKASDRARKDPKAMGGNPW